MKLVKTSYTIYDVEVLLQDVKELGNKERTILQNKGVHYSEMLPFEYTPTEDYNKIFLDSLKNLSSETANAVAILGEKLWEEKGKNIILVSLARTGTPIGILIKRYLKYKYNVSVPHYSISLIRKKGIDTEAMNFITSRHFAKNITFIAGWIDNDTITALKESCKKLKKSNNRYKDLDDRLAVLTDPTFLTNLYGTRKDLLIPSACLNSTVYGLISHTIITKDMTDEEFHGAIYYEENEDKDFSYEFIDTVVKHFPNTDLHYFTDNEDFNDYKGIDEVNEIAKQFSVKDINKIKPSVGETTRLLLRSYPNRVLINKEAPKKYIKPILQLAKEKKVPVVYYPLKKYYACGIIKNGAN